MEQNSSGGFDRDQLKDVQSWRRSRSDRMLAGVCGGMGRALNVDPVLIRVVMAVLILSGPGIIFYGAAWVLMPDEGSDRSAAQGVLGDRVRPDHPWLWPVVIGVCVFSAIALMSSFNFGKLIPGPLVVLGLLWLFVFRRKGRSHWGHRNVPWGERSAERAQRTVERVQRHAERHIQRAQQGQSQWTHQAAQWSAANRPPPQTGPQAPPAATERPQDRVTEPVQPVWTEDDPLGLYVDEQPAATVIRPPAAPPVKGYRGVKPVVALLAASAIAIAWLSGAPTTTMLVIGLATLGLGMVLGGFLGKTIGLLPLGILLALATAASTVFPHIPRDIASVDFVATPNDSITAVSTTYRFDAGSVKLDLSKAVFQPGAKVFVDGGAGEVVVKLPPNVDVTGNLTADTGQVDAFGTTKGGRGAKMGLTDLGVDGKAGPQTVALDLHVKLGSIRVER
jgi:phage shock protein PspC (stress-responsive transcriptional regulator)